MRLLRFAVLCGLMAALAACQTNDLKEPPPALGDFVLGLNIAVADNVQKVPISRDADPKAWEEAVKSAISDRFGRYEGSRIYNIGISIDAYALAPPGIPLVFSPKSILVVTANIWDDASATKLNPEGKQFTIFEGASADTMIGSGLTQTKKKQMATLSYNVAKSVEKWLLTHPEWFDATQLPTSLAAKAELATPSISAPLKPKPKPKPKSQTISPQTAATSPNIGATP